MEEHVGLIANRRGDTRVCVPHVRDAETGGEVHEAVAVDVPDIGTRGPLPEERRRRCDARGVTALHFREALGETARSRPGDSGDELRRERRRGDRSTRGTCGHGAGV